MRYTIRHGSEIEAATPGEVAAIIASAFDTRSSVDYRRPKGLVSLDGSGNGAATVEKVSSQYDWVCERLTLAGNGAAGALVQFFENSASDLDLLEVVQIGAAGLYSDSYSNSLYLPANSQLVIQVTGGTPNGQVSYNLQLRQLQRRQ